MIYFEEIAASTNYAPFVLSKLSISMSIKSDVSLTDADFKTVSYGLKLNRQTITGEWDDLLKSLIEMFEGCCINDNKYFQKYLKSHIYRGAKLIIQRIQI